MPSVVSERIGSRNPSESESDKLSKAMQTVMIRVKGALRLRYLMNRKEVFVLLKFFCFCLYPGLNC